MRLNPSPAGEKSSLSIYGFHRSPEWVAMCISLLGCVWVDPRKSQNNGMNQLYPRFPLVRRFPDFHRIWECELGREREADTGEDLTQGVSESLASTTLVTLVNTWYDTPSFCFHPDALEPLCG